jgi:UDP-N-acetylglucosamine--N-acetylmuramyl-(pentapeptide) pyrophosphoryl-undecaprenol N-acetylglucosamine transferase
MNKRVIISGGGTGGHIFPAIAIANAILRLAPDTEILFVGALGRMEMEKVPAAGYNIIGLDIQGLNRKSLLKNLILPFKIIKSLRAAKAILKDFKPDVAIGVGGYASGPLLIAAKNKKIPYLIQEQNSYAGLTNKRLGKNAEKICVAYEGMEVFFPKEKLFFTGNPIRKESVAIEGKRELGLSEFGLSAQRKTILITGGSLGARTLNQSIMAGLDKIVDADIQVIWQCGNYYFEKYDLELDNKYRNHIVLKPFLPHMDLAYAAADLIVSRAGAGTIAELCVLSKPIILVPSPNVAEDHQTSNAKTLVSKNAAVLIKDNEAVETLIESAIHLLKNKEKCTSLARNSRELAVLNADEIIAKEVLRIAEEN